MKCEWNFVSCIHYLWWMWWLLVYNMLIPLVVRSSSLFGIMLTLRGLTLFFKILPISSAGTSIAYILATVHFLYPKLASFSDMEDYFYQLAYRDLKVPKHFVGLNQMQCSPSFDWNWGKQNHPTACWHQLHPRFQILQQGKCLRYPPKRIGRVTETTNCVGGEGLSPLPTINTGKTPFKIPPCSRYLGQRAIEKLYWKCFFIVGLCEIHHCIYIVLFDYMCVLHHSLASSLYNFVLCCVPCITKTII